MYRKKNREIQVEEVKFPLAFCAGNVYNYAKTAPRFMFVDSNILSRDGFFFKGLVNFRKIF